jgi:predicted transposase YbfD/YdcC
MESFRVIFGGLPDPRDLNAHHDLTEIIFIALAATLCGANSCVEFAEFGEDKEPLLRRFLELKHGIPSHDTFSRVFRRLDPLPFEAALARFAAALGATLGQDPQAGVIAIDGKSLRRGYEKGRAHMPPLLVSAYLSRTRITLAQTLAQANSEIEATLELLNLVALDGATVTADALHCNTRMAAALRERGAHYCLALKGNRSTLLRDANDLLAAAGEAVTAAETVEQAHGRHERRRACVIEATDRIEHHRFKDLTAFGCIDAWRTIDDETSHRRRLFALSRVMSPTEFLATAREHWAIENGAHWPLDVVFQEDLARTRKNNDRVILPSCGASPSILCALIPTKLLSTSNDAEQVGMTTSSSSSLLICNSPALAGEGRVGDWVPASLSPT